MQFTSNFKVYGLFLLNMVLIGCENRADFETPKPMPVMTEKATNCVPKKQSLLDRSQRSGPTVLVTSIPNQTRIGALTTLESLYMSIQTTNDIHLIFYSA